MVLARRRERTKSVQVERLKEVGLLLEQILETATRLEFDEIVDERVRRVEILLGLEALHHLRIRGYLQQTPKRVHVVHSRGIVDKAHLKREKGCLRWTHQLYLPRRCWMQTPISSRES